ncbi:MAG: SPOR domain-containing protein [Thauera sp.]|nr:SPOR domain-containing protein [Thauera sp.]
MSDADNLELKKRSRRRLVGAAALALLAAIVLPMMMDQAPRSASQDIQVSIPDRDGGGARPIGGRDRAEVEAPVAPAPDEQPAAGTSVEPDGAAAKPPVAVAPTPLPRSEPKAESRTEARPELRAEAKPALSAADAEAARAKAALGGQEPAPRNEAYVVQVGAFGDAEKAARIAADLKKQGFAAYTEKAGSVTRVRIGPVNGREAADRTAAKLKAQGYSAALSPR